MLKVTRFSVENLTEGCVTDAKQPSFSFSLESDRQNVTLKKALIRLGNWKKETTSQISVPYEGPALKPFTCYEAKLEVTDDAGETATSAVAFETGRLDTPWTGEWISDPAFLFTEKGVSPVPMVFRKAVSLKKPVKRAIINATAMGI